MSAAIAVPLASAGGAFLALGLYAEHRMMAVAGSLLLLASVAVIVL